MLCSSCGTECADGLDTCPGCGAPLKAASVPDDTIPIPLVSEAAAAHTRKKPVKLDIAAILAADPDFAFNPAPAASNVEPVTPEARGSSVKPAAQSSDSNDPSADEASAEPINPANVLLLSLCILLGLAIAVMILLIIWPNLISMLFYRA